MTPLWPLLINLNPEKKVENYTFIAEDKIYTETKDNGYLFVDRFLID